MEGEPKLPLEAVADEVANATVEVARGAAYLGRVLGWDEWMLLGMRRFHSPWRTAAARALTRAGDGWTWTGAGMTLLGIGLVTRSRATTQTKAASSMIRKPRKRRSRGSLHWP